MKTRLSAIAITVALGSHAAMPGGLSGEAQRPGPPVQSVSSPDGQVRFELDTASGGLRYRIRRGPASVVEWSSAGILVDGVNLADTARMIGAVSRSDTRQTYATRGVHRIARDHSSNATFTFEHPATATRFEVDVRAFDDGVGFRFRVPGAGRRVPDEATSFILPAGSMTWTHDLHGHYEALYVRRAIDDVPSGDWAAPPVTYKLPGSAGYASITEAALTAYAGMALQADGRGGYAARLGHAHPVSYPYALRYRAEDVLRLARAAAIEGPIQTPWRVVLVAADLNGLVNSDVVSNLAPPPDAKLFPQGPATPWVKPGRAVWRYLDGGENTYEGLQGFTELAEKLGYEYHVVEGVWRQWTPEQLKAFGEHAREHHVGILLWKHSREMQTAAERKAFWDLCQANGIAGAKIDFFDHEAKEVIDLYDTILREAAERRLVLDFHGANKPTGMDRTWPNELTREAVYGFEHRGTAPWGPHNTTLPFTRLLAGSADYTPTVFGARRRETSWTHQVAAAIVFTSTLLVYGGHPQSFIDSPAAEILRAIPATWDETRVLPPSEIGEVAVIARRSGRDWFLAAINGAEGRAVRVVPSFLGTGRYTAAMARDNDSEAAAMNMQTATISAGDAIAFALRPGGGFVAWFRPVN